MKESISSCPLFIESLDPGEGFINTQGQYCIAVVCREAGMEFHKRRSVCILQYSMGLYKHRIEAGVQSIFSVH